MRDDFAPHTRSNGNILELHYELWSILVTQLCNKSICLTSAKYYPLLSFSSEHLSSSFPPFHLCIIPLTSPFLQHPSFLLILCHLLPSSFSAICLHSVCASREFPFCLWGELRFSLLRSSLVLLLYVFHAGKGSSSCMQQGVCSVCGCPIRDPTM